MCAPIPAPLSRNCSVYHICCIPDGPANAIEPTTIGNQASDNALSGMNPIANMPARVWARSSQLPTIAAMIDVPTTRKPISNPSNFSRKL